MRKKFVLLIFSFILSLCILYVNTPYAMAMSDDLITVKINGKNIQFTQNPILKDDRVLVPMRVIFEEFGMDVKWDDKTQQIISSNGGLVITLQIGNNYAVLKTERTFNKTALDVSPQIINGVTMVPVRFISESTEAEVEWDQLTKTVNISYDKEKISKDINPDYDNSIIYSVNIEDIIISLGDSVDSVVEKLGQPNRIDERYTKLDWYVYNSDYKKFIMIGTSNNIVLSIYTNHTNFIVNDVIKCGASKDKLPESKQINYEIDKIGGDILYGVMVSYKNLGDFWVPAADFNLRSPIIELHELDCLNAFRVHNGLKPLKIDVIAQKTAREHSKDMAENGYFAHEGLDGRDGRDRYNDNNGKNTACAENIAAGYDTGMFQFKGYLNSIGHRRNMLTKNAKYVGIGEYYDMYSKYRYFGTQLFTY